MEHNSLGAMGTCGNTESVLPCDKYPESSTVAGLQIEADFCESAGSALEEHVNIVHL